MTLHLTPTQASLPFTAVDAMKMMEAVTKAFAAGVSQKGTTLKTPAFLDQLHRLGYTVTPFFGAVDAVRIADEPAWEDTADGADEQT